MTNTDIMAKRIFRESSEGTKWKQSLRKNGPLNPNYGQPRDEITKAKIAQSMRDYWASIPNKPKDDENK